MMTPHEITHAEMPPITVINQVPDHGNRMGVKGRVLAAGLALSTIIGATLAVEHGLPHLGLPHIDFGNMFDGHASPGTVQTKPAIVETFRTEAEFDTQCIATLSAGVPVKGGKDYYYKVDLGFVEHSFRTGSAEVDKVIYGDEDGCADTGSVVASAVIEGVNITQDGKTTTEIESVSATTTGIEPHRARVNHAMWQNLVDERFSDSPQTINDKETKWLNDKNHGEDDGFSISGVSGADVAAIKDMADTAAQAGLAVSEIPQSILDQQNARLKAGTEKQLQALYPNAKKVHVDVIPRPLEQQQDRLQVEVAELTRNFYKVDVRKSVNPKTQAEETTLHIVSPGGTEMDVKAGTVNAGEVSVIGLNKLSEKTSTVPQPTTTVNSSQRKA